MKGYAIRLDKAIELFGKVPRQGDWVTFDDMDYLVYKVNIEGFDPLSPSTFEHETEGAMVYLSIYPAQGETKRKVE